MRDDLITRALAVVIGRSIVSVEFHQPAIYRIRVKGHLDTDWSDRLGGLEIRVIDQAGSTSETILMGWLPDQAALSGVLNALYGLHLSLISVALISLDCEPRSALDDRPHEAQHRVVAEPIPQSPRAAEDSSRD